MLEKPNKSKIGPLKILAVPIKMSTKSTKRRNSGSKK